MRTHYESLNYIDGTPGSSRFRFTRTQGSTSGFMARTDIVNSHDHSLVRAEVERLRDMLNEVLEDWKVA